MDIRKLRGKLTRKAFAAKLGVPVRTLEGWENGRKMSTAAARLVQVVGR